MSPPPRPQGGPRPTGCIPGHSRLHSHHRGLQTWLCRQSVSRQVPGLHPAVGGAAEECRPLSISGGTDDPLCPCTRRALGGWGGSRAASVPVARTGSASYYRGVAGSEPCQATWQTVLLAGLVADGAVVGSAATSCLGVDLPSPASLLSGCTGAHSPAKAPLFGNGCQLSAGQRGVPGGRLTRPSCPRRSRVRVCLHIPGRGLPLPRGVHIPETQA